MTRVACVLTRTDDELLLRPWLLYHGYVFGFENLHVRDAGSSRDEVMAILKEFTALGIHLELVPTDTAGEPVAQDLYDIALPLACDEFVAINGSEGVGCNATAIRDEVHRIHEDRLSCRVSGCLESLPGHLDLFSYLERGASIQLGPQSDSDSQPTPSATTLILIRLCRNPLDPGYRLPLLRFSGVARLLGALNTLATFREAWESRGLEPPPDDALEVDLDRHPFRGPDYLRANPDLPGAELDPLAHFLAGGYFEGRAMEASDAGRNEVLERLAAIRERRPDGSSGYVGLASALGALKRAGEGDAILEHAIREFGATRELVREYALLATVRESYAQAARRWDIFRCLFPGDPEGFGYAASARRLRGDLEGAQRILTAGLERFPQDAGLTGEQRETVFLLRVRRLEESDTHALLPMDGPVDVLMSEADTQAALEFLNLPDVEALRDFFLGFESLGHSCEFGLVQRRFGADPLSLLRWNSIHAAKLIEALSERFAGIDEADNLTLIESYDEYVLRDFRYHTSMHTFYRATEIDSEKLMGQTLKRMSYLRRKLISDLEQGEKIFVHLDDRSLSEKDLARLGHVMRAYGENTLLYVRVADSPAQIGRVEQAGDGLFVGYIDRLGRDKNDVWNISFDCWLALCRETSLRVRSASAGSQMHQQVSPNPPPQAAGVA